MGTSIELSPKQEESNPEPTSEQREPTSEQREPTSEQNNDADINETKNEDVLCEIAKITFSQLFENFLIHNKEKINKINIEISPEIQEYFILLCKEKPGFFGDVEQTLNKIIVDNTINTKDVPEIIVLVTKIIEIIKNQNNKPNVDPYELIKTLLHVLFIVYIETNKIDNPELVIDLVKIIDISIDLIKLKGFKPKKIDYYTRCIRFFIVPRFMR